MELENLDSIFIKEITKLVRANPGECEMKIRIKDASDGIYLDFHPRKFRVNPSGFVRAISGFEQIEYKLNGFNNA
jgi:hypothetical protein